jgi:rhomboid protease GluP
VIDPKNEAQCVIWPLNDVAPKNYLATLFQVIQQQKSAWDIVHLDATSLTLSDNRTSKNPQRLQIVLADHEVSYETQEPFDLNQEEAELFHFRAIKAADHPSEFLDEALEMLDKALYEFNEFKEISHNRSIKNTLLPSKRNLITPIIVFLNVLIFVVMVFSGVHFFLPDAADMVVWGANFKPKVVEGEYYRLLTSAFLHFGILHLVLNMYALIFVGIFIEKAIGAYRYATAYLASGIIGSVVSLFWHNNPTVGAGASGAVFGMFGLFLALLLFKVFSKTMIRNFLQTILIFIVINLGIGMKQGIDNAAHLGGLISGFVFGVAMIPALKPQKVTAVLRTLYLPLVALSVIGSIWLVSRLDNNYSVFDQNGDAFAEYEETAVNELQRLDLDDPNAKNSLTNIILPAWHSADSVIGVMQGLKIDDGYKSRLTNTHVYCSLRIEQTILLMSLTDRIDVSTENELLRINKELEVLLEEFGNN